MPKLKTADRVIRMRVYTIIENAVEDGMRLGMNHAYKHTDTPTRESIEECLVHDVMNALFEVVEFGDA